MTSMWDELDKGMLHALGGMELEGVRFHHTTGNSMKFKMYELFIYGMLHCIFSDWLTAGNWNSRKWNFW